ncbi:hypothetical protein [Mucilaginibacter sp. dw_454]|uniref:hypothetical protein n=1 Tax=Mucilaginibacter sp. dw_454 TaxID=2720079 RepID=UPI001BD2819D|nr:hypothetical protein [Mucilaginibacter sp. dw_454]
MKTRLIVLAAVLAIVAFSKNSFSNLSPVVGKRNLVARAKMEHEAGLKEQINLGIPFFAPGNALSGYSTYTPGTTVLRSTNGEFNLNYQTDGNLVLCNNTGTAYWASGPQATDAFWVVFALTGDINEWKGIGGVTKYWDANIPGSCPCSPNTYFWILQNDGNLVKYAGTPSNPNYALGSVSTGTGGPVRSSHFNTIQ